MEALQPIAAIALVMVLLGAGLLLLKKRGIASFRLPGVPGANPARRLEVMERVSLGPHHAIHLVRAEGRILLIACSPNSCQILDHRLSPKTCGPGENA